MVTKIGTKVTKFKVRDKVGVGCIIGSCCSCANCKDDLENCCPKMILSYGAKYNDGTTTYGGYWNIMVSDKHFVIKILDNLPLDGGTPLLCAGITIYSPLKYYGLNKARMHLGVIGLGGLEHIAVKFAKAMGLKVTVISTSPNKKKEAMDHLGADTFLVTYNTKEMELAMGTMDGIIDTVSAVHALLPLINLLKINKKLIMVGAPEKPLALLAFPLLMGRKMVGGSCIGGIKETQEIIDFAMKHNIIVDIELNPMDYVSVYRKQMLRIDLSLTSPIH